MRPERYEGAALRLLSWNVASLRAMLTKVIARNVTCRLDVRLLSLAQLHTWSVPVVTESLFSPSNMLVRIAERMYAICA